MKTKNKSQCGVISNRVAPNMGETKVVARTCHTMHMHMAKKFGQQLDLSQDEIEIKIIWQKARVLQCVST